MEMPAAGPAPPEDLFAEIEAGLRQGASDWQFKGGEPCAVRIRGDMARLETGPLPEVRLQAIAAAALGRAGRVPADLDAAFARAGECFRIHTYSAGGIFCFNLRHIPGRIPALELLGLPAAFRDAARRSTRGLILVTGPAGAGKSTTLAAVVDHRNRHRPEVIFTFEDPVEFRHPGRRAVVRQLQKGQDFADFGAALRGALRCDPDTILVGEMRDPETVAAAIGAADTGHLVLATLHCGAARDAVSRVLESYPGERIGEVRGQLAKCLVAVLAQQLVHTRERRLESAFELLLPTPAVRHVIADPGARLELLDHEIATGRAHGMVAMDQALEDLWRRQVIDRDEALRAAARPAALEQRLRP
jgi:twitching motility protein PilT